MTALVRRCHLLFQKMMIHSGVMQVIFVWLVICSCSSSSIRIDDTLVRIAELHIRICGNAGHVFASCNYLRHKAYQPLY
jgi:hypothetical protein